jgi:hypothetical protein
VEVDDDRVVRIRPDQQHVATEGFACKKGLRQHELYSTPDRLASPMRRQGDRFEAIDWQTANQEIGEKLRSIIQQHGPNAVALYVGTAAGFSVLHPVFAQGFLTGLGSTNTYASATQDCANKFAVAARDIKLVGRADLKAPVLADLAGLDDGAFRAMFSGSPIKRIGRDRFVRNVLYAIGNSGEAKLLPVAQGLCADADAAVADAARWAVARLR